MGNADWNPTQARVFDVYMAGGGGQGGQGLMDIFSCNGNNNMNAERSGQGCQTHDGNVGNINDGDENSCAHNYTAADTVNRSIIGVTLNGKRGASCSGGASAAGTAGATGPAVFSGGAANSMPTPPRRTNPNGTCNGSSTELYNTGIGRAAPSLTPEFFEGLKRRRVESRPHGVAPALNLQSTSVSSSGMTGTVPRILNAGPISMATSTHRSTPPNIGYTPVSATGSRSGTPPSAAYGQTDKWPSQMESAFISALRVIIKNGTSKFKILDRNYGRNELISLYVEYHVGEVRTKKQISSHIQVWKKSILNKMTGNFKLTSLDHEMLKLIEDGAPQSDETNKFFYDTFEHIVTCLSQRRRTSDSAVTNQSSSFEYSRAGASAASAGGAADYLLTPVTAAHATLGSSSSIANLSQGNGGPAAQFAPSSTPVTPIDYAKSIYGNLKTYKCVPVKVQEPLRSTNQSNSNHYVAAGGTGSSNFDAPPVSHQYVYGGNTNVNSSGSNLTSAQPLLQTAKDVELQQRQLIENLSLSSHQQQRPQSSPSTLQQRLRLPPVSSELYARASPTQTTTTSNTQLPQLPQLPQLHFGDLQPQIYVPVVATDTGNVSAGTKRSFNEV